MLFEVNVCLTDFAAVRRNISQIH